MSALNYFKSNGASINPRTVYPSKPNKNFTPVSVSGDYGIEIEIEPSSGSQGLNDLSRDALSYWTVHNDGSLRNGGLEYVLRTPLPYQTLQPATDLLYASLGKNLRASIRTSTHVHMNVKGFKFNNLMSVLVLYYMVEDIVVPWCGAHRMGNLFCLRASDSPMIIKSWQDYFRRDGRRSRFNEEQDRYTALNPCALDKFGSLEFRSMGGAKSTEEVMKWVDLINRIKTLALTKYVNPQEILNTFSGCVPVDFFGELFGDLAIFPEILKACEQHEVNISDAMWEGMRRVQPLVYSYDWEVFLSKSKEVDIPDPFGKTSTGSSLPRRHVDGEALVPGIRGRRAEFIVHDEFANNGADLEAFLARAPRAPLGIR